MALPASLRKVAVQQQLDSSALVVTTTPGVLLKRHGVDVSNYTGPLSDETLAAWRDEHDIGLVIVQAIDPPLGYPVTQTRQQVEACWDAEIACDVYLYLWTLSNVEENMREKLALLNGIEHKVRKVWLDCEDTTSATYDQRMSAIRRALAVVDGWCMAHDKPLPGIYTGAWWWVGYVHDTDEFSELPLWDATYDGIDDASVFVPYGGWTECRIKQYVGSSELAGQGEIDLNVLSEAERRG